MDFHLLRCTVTFDDYFVQKGSMLKVMPIQEDSSMVTGKEDSTLKLGRLDGS